MAFKYDSDFLMPNNNDPRMKGGFVDDESGAFFVWLQKIPDLHIARLQYNDDNFDFSISTASRDNKTTYTINRYKCGKSEDDFQKQKPKIRMLIKDALLAELNLFYGHMPPEKFDLDGCVFEFTF